MERVWAAEVVVDTTLARELIESQFPELRPVTLEPLNAGWDNTVFLVNASLIFRFPRRSIAVPLMVTEVQVLPWLSSVLHVSIPVPIHIGQPSSSYTWPFAGYPMIRGWTLQSIEISPAERTALGKPLALFLKALHAVPAPETVPRGSGPDALNRLDMGKQDQRARQRLKALRDAGGLEGTRAIEEVLEQAPHLSPDPHHHVLVHGDLHAGQIIIDDDHALAGIIDWGDVHVGHPAVDLAAAHCVLPRDTHQAFLDTYGPVDAATWQIARVRAMWITIAGLASAWDTGNRQEVHDLRATIERICR